MRDLDWFFPVAVIVGLQCALWLLLAVSGLAPRPLFSLNADIAYLAFAIYALAQFCSFLARMMWQREPHPLARSITLLKANRTRVIVTVVAIQIIGLQAAVFAATKAAIPALNPFWLDPYLARFDAILFGEPPFRLARRIFEPIISLFDAAYAAWIAVQVFSVIAVLLLRPSELKTQALVSLALMWFVIGTLGAIACSSVGPVFYDRVYGGNLFSGVPLGDAYLASRESSHLWNGYVSRDLKLGGGISAMPSMHVALVVWLALVVRKTVLAPIAWAYVGVVWIGSVLLGWHYFTDGLVGMAGALAVWKLTPKLLAVFPSWRVSQRGPRLTMGAASS